MNAWTTGRLPIAVEPLPGEDLLSWIAAYSRRLRISSLRFANLVGLPTTGTGRLTVRLTGEEAEALHRRTGVDPDRLRAMTLTPWDQIAVTVLPQRRRLGHAPTWDTLPYGRIRYCPRCLENQRGRGPVAWRLPWSFACPVHRCLMLDACPACRHAPRLWAVHGRPTDPVPRCQYTRPPHSRHTPCLQPLTDVEPAPLPAGSPVFAAQGEVLRLLTLPETEREQSRAGLACLHTVAIRILTALSHLADTWPQPAQTVLEHCGIAPDTDRRIERDNAGIAAAVTLAHLALNGEHRDHEQVVEWLIEANQRRTQPGRTRSAAFPETLWTGTGETIAARVLAHRDQALPVTERVRYRSATPRPELPALPRSTLVRRAAHVPGMLWPSWTMRLLPRNTPTGAFRGGHRRSHSPQALRRALSVLLLLTGAPTDDLNCRQAAALLDLGIQAGDSTALERGVLRGIDTTAIAQALPELADELDHKGSPIDYARRRRLFTTGLITVDTATYQRLSQGQPHPLDGPTGATCAEGFIRQLLTGEEPGRHPRNGAYEPNPDAGLFTHRLTPGLRAFLHHQAQHNLDLHHITEPLTWEPPASWTPPITWPGITPGVFDGVALRKTIAAARTADQAAQQLGWHVEHVRLITETTPAMPWTHDTLERGNPTPSATPTPSPRPRQKVASAWLYEQYVTRRRSAASIAEQTGYTVSGICRALDRYGIAKRPHRAGAHDATGHLDLPHELSPAMRTLVTMPDALNRLHLLVQIPGHPSLAAAGRALTPDNPVGLASRLAHIERRTGLTLIDRCQHPLTPTPQGRLFLAEAETILDSARRAK